MTTDLKLLDEAVRRAWLNGLFWKCVSGMPKYSIHLGDNAEPFIRAEYHRLLGMNAQFRDQASAWIFGWRLF